jgi:SAM-dependent methyltransferase
MRKDIYSKMRQLEDEHWWFVARRRIIQNLLETFSLPKKSEILEIGCGTGGNIALLQNYGNVICVEVDKIAAELARSRNLAPVLEGKLPKDLPELNRSFDLIVLLDVLEHVEEDEASLRVLASMVDPKGKIVITVPAFNFLWSQHDSENQHYRRYHHSDLVKMARSCGLNIEYISYFNFWLFPPVAFVRLLRKIFPYNESWRDMRMPSLWLNSVLNWIFSTERHLLGKVRVPFGISLLAVLSSSVNKAHG